MVHVQFANVGVLSKNLIMNLSFYRRGYATEKQKGLLLVEKLDYIQSVVLRGIFSTISKPLRKVGKLINKV